MRRSNSSPPAVRIRSEFTALLHENLKRFLVPTTARPLHEIFTFSATGAVRRNLVGKLVNIGV